MLIDCVVLKAETKTCMRLLGCERVSDLGLRQVSYPWPKFGVEAHYFQINSRAVERDIYDGNPGLEKLGLWVKANL